MAGGFCCYEVFSTHIWGGKTQTHTWTPFQTIWAYAVPLLHNRLGKFGESRFFGYFWPIFLILVLQREIGHGFAMSFRDILKRRWDVVVTFRVSWNIYWGSMFIVRNACAPPGHFRPLPATYISKDFDYYFMKVAILRQNIIFQDENTLYLDSAWR